MYKRKNPTLKELIIKCINYSIHMKELYFTNYDEDRLKEYVERLEKK